MPGPARDLHANQHVVAILGFAEHVRARSEQRVVTDPDLFDQRLEGGAAGLERRGLLALCLKPREERLVLAVEDVNLVLPVGLGQENTKIGVGEFEVDCVIGDLDDGVVPPGDALLLVQNAQDAFVERVVEKDALSLDRGLVRRPAGISDDREQKHAEKSNRHPDEGG
ncbi:hypothetical protein AUC69_15395 [Methyloceanibacter superfactus]|uniref:Uncharacterized protein n=1 Tax=Methyloceanibacter superfactus TaxID=1774969 RepID=A0A1E3VS95_9HYPH|nr:hypothetical protein [Methyloceanibacter superfactus]ODR96151.1 hypothetical protein AUC69_15395 [Methyloceanibacter superfactus]